MPHREQAIRELYEQYADQIYRFLLWQTSDPLLAEDITSEVFFRAWKQRDKLTTGNQRAWLYRVARNLVTDHWRKKRPAPLDEAIDLALDYDLAKQVEQNDELRIMREHVGSLPANLQIVIRLRFFEHLPTNEVAGIMGKSEGAIRVLQYRALKELKKLQDRYDKA